MAGVVVPGLAGQLRGWMAARELFIRASGEVPLPWQEEYLRETRDTIVLKGRQVGASTASGVVAIRRALYWPGSLVVVLSPSLKQSTEVKDRAKAGLLALGERLARDSSSLVQLTNGSRVISLPGSAKSARGWSADLLVLDEAAFIEPETFLAARAMVAATGGRTIVQSTPEGPFGNFYDLWVDNDPRWARFKVRSDEVPTIEPAFLAAERAAMTEEDFLQEYGAQFTNPGLGLVDPDRLRDLTGTEPNPSDVWARVGRPASGS